MKFQKFLAGVCAATIGVAGAQALDGDHNNADALGQILWPDLLNVADVENGDSPVKSVVDGGAVRV